MLAGFAVFGILYIVGDISDDQQAQVILSLISKVLMLFIVILSIPGLIAGLGLLRRKEWARILALIVSAISLLNFPLGTAVGVYSIWAWCIPRSLPNSKLKSVQVQFEVKISGNVQGVGYRMFTQLKAKECNISGWVKNKSDGSVMVVACGEEPDVMTFLDYLKQGPALSRVTGIIKNRIPNPEHFDGFRIRY